MTARRTSTGTRTGDASRARRSTAKQKPAVRTARRARPADAPPAPKDPHGLEADERAFVLEYVRNGGNGTKAYLVVHPEVKAESAATLGYRLLRKVQVCRAIDEAERERWKRLEMQGDEAIALISLSARADIADAYDENGSLLAVHLWPATLRLAVKAIKPNGEIVLHDALKARELIAVATGRLRHSLNVLHNFDHAGYLAGLDDPKAPEVPK